LNIDRIRSEYKNAVHKKNELSEALRQLEEKQPDDVYNIWITRDQIAYWEGKSEGLKIAMDELDIRE
jgi:uncharacterized hydantoinase/oxoprolinase family protein